MRILHARRRSVLTRSLIGAGLLTALVGSFGAGACTVFDTEPIGAWDASIGSGGTGGSGGEDSGPPRPWWETTRGGCRVRTPPTPEDGPFSSTEGDTKADIFMAMTYIRLGATGEPSEILANHLQFNQTAYQDIGFDLDGRCTRATTCAQEDGGLIQEEHCYRPPNPAGGKVGATDGNGCSDNAVGTTIPISYTAGSTSDLFGVNENDWNCELFRGGFGVMFRIRNYNWTPNDPTVTLDVYNTMGTQEQRSWKCRPNSSSEEAIASWRAESGWQDTPLVKWRFARSNWEPADDPSPTSTTVLPNSKTHSEVAYVKDGYLVAFLSKASSIGFIGSEQTTIAGIRLTFERAILAGRLVHAGDSWSLEDATLGGAVDPATMMQSFERIGYCENNMCQSFRIVETVLDSVRDIYLDPEREAAPDDPTQPCDGMSIGMQLGAVAARGDEFVKTDDPFVTRCPEPRHPDANPQYCTCGPSDTEAKCDDAGAGGTGGTGGTGGGNGDGGS